MEDTCCCGIIFKLHGAVPKTTLLHEQINMVLHSYCLRSHVIEHSIKLVPDLLFGDF